MTSSISAPEASSHDSQLDSLPSSVRPCTTTSVSPGPAEGARGDDTVIEPIAVQSSSSANVAFVTAQQASPGLTADSGVHAGKTGAARASVGQLSLKQKPSEQRQYPSARGQSESVAHAGSVMSGRQPVSRETAQKKRTRPD